MNRRHAIPRTAGRRRRRWLLALRLALPLGLLAVSVWLVASTRQLEKANRQPQRVSRALPFNPALSSPSPAVRVDDEVVPSPPLELALASGETLSQVLERLGLESGEALEAATALGEHVDLRKLKAGDSYAAYFEDGARLASFELAVERRGRVSLARGRDGWEASWRPFVRTVQTRVVRGELTGALEAAVREAGGEALVAYRMADVLQWDLDFNRDLRLGDRFNALYEEVFLDGQRDSVGQILALTYENRGQLYEVYRFGDDGGYYDAEGRPLKKMFLRSPLRFSRITSGFSRSRFHPVLKTRRPHWGVDYGAPVGTPVRVTANGTVTFAGWNNGGGRTIKVRHPNGYLTAYLHLSRFADGIRPGAVVRQEQVIGYVGATGLATGPHLDYRVQKNGRWINPLSLSSVPGKPLSSSEMPAFRRWRDLLRSCLKEGRPLPADATPEPQIAERPGSATATEVAR